MLSNRTISLVVLGLLISPAAFSDAGKPNFSPAIYGDGKLWGTKGAATLPAPNGSNDRSYDKLFVFVNGAIGQMPVAEAAPGNPMYNGGRWFTHTVVWKDSAIAYHGGTLPVLTSYQDIQRELLAGN